MIKSGIDQEALIAMLSSASARQGEMVRASVRDMTLKALQGRELTLQNIRKVLSTVTAAASAGALKNAAPAIDVEALLEQTLTGMDDALLKAVEANRMALQQFVDQGVNLQESQLKKALGDLERFEDALFNSVSKGSVDAGDRVQAMWQPVLDAMRMKGTATGATADATAQQLMGQMQTAMRASRAAGLRAANAMAQNYAALVSGVLIGMSEALKSGQGGSGAGRKASSSSK